MAIITDGNRHSIGVNVKTDEGNDWPVYLLLLFVRQTKLIPQF